VIIYLFQQSMNVVSCLQALLRPTLHAADLIPFHMVFFRCIVSVVTLLRRQPARNCHWSPVFVTF